jgi:anti-anti-sigma factor
MIETHARENIIVVVGRGEWDLSTVVVEERVLEMAAQWPLVVLDLAALRFLDLTAAHPVERLVATAAEHGTQVVLVNPQPEPERVLRFLGLGEHIVPLERLPEVPGEVMAQLRSAANAGEDDDR